MIVMGGNGICTLSPVISENVVELQIQISERIRLLTFWDQSEVTGNLWKLQMRQKHNNWKWNVTPKKGTCGYHL